jgi:hypothetical protein
MARFENRTPRPVTRRLHPSSNRLGLFGRRHGAQLLVLDRPTLDDLAEGKTVTIHVQGHILYIRSTATGGDAAEVSKQPSHPTSPIVELVRCPHCRSTRPTQDERVMAARIVLDLDRVDKRQSPEWLQRLGAEGEQ